MQNNNLKHVEFSDQFNLFYKKDNQLSHELKSGVEFNVVQYGSLVIHYHLWPLSGRLPWQALKGRAQSYGLILQIS